MASSPPRGPGSTACSAPRQRDRSRAGEPVREGGGRAHPFRLVAFLSTDGPAVPEGPCNRQLQGLADFLAYMDEGAELWRKRYAWERAARGQWQHYIDDLSTFFAFLDATEGLAAQMARRRGIVRWPPQRAIRPKVFVKWPE